MENQKVVTDYDQLAEFAEAHKTLGHKVVCTIGSWDMLHIGHLRYLNRAKERGDILIVGADSDRAIKTYKGPLRPIIPENERMEMLSYQDCVDYVTLIDDVGGESGWRYGLLKAIRPDIFVCINESYSENQRHDISLLVGELVELPRQAENTSTSSIIEKTIKAHVAEIDKLGSNGAP